MIESIQHIGLKLLWRKGDQSKLLPVMIPKILRILTIIDALEIVPGDLLDLPFLQPHSLKGELDGYWTMDVSGNWRVIFRFDNVRRNAYDLDFIDYY